MMRCCGSAPRLSRWATRLWRLVCLIATRKANIFDWPDALQGQFREILDNEQRFRKIFIIEIDAPGDYHRNAGQRSSNKAVVRVFNGNTTRRRHGQSPQHFKIHIRRGFFPRDLVAGNDGIEPIRPMLPERGRQQGVDIVEGCRGGDCQALATPARGYEKSLYAWPQRVIAVRHKLGITRGLDLMEFDDLVIGKKRRASARPVEGAD